jgi:TMEM175 potassium channel family protein
MQQKSRLIEKLRLDALTDGVFAVAMTLLVIDLKLPENFHPTTADEFLHGLAELQTQFLVYVISFIVLGLRWMSLAKLSRLHEAVEDRYVHWALLHLLLVTCVPFVTMVVGRYGALAPAIWLYCAITVMAALVALRLTTLAEPHIGTEDALDRRVGLMVIIVVSLMVLAFSFVQPKHAMWIYLLNIFAPGVRRWIPAAKP